MTFEVKIKDGPRYTLWNVTKIHVQDNKTVVEHSDRKDTAIEGYAEKITRRD